MEKNIIEKINNIKYQENLIHTIYNAGQIALAEQFSNKNITKIKTDNSKVSLTDLNINNYISNYLNKVYSNIKILSEENTLESQIEAIKENFFFIIDPIDGTEQFIKGENFFTINLSAIYKNRPIFSIIYAPALRIMMYADNNYTYNVVIKNNIIKKNILISKIKKNSKKKLKVLTTHRSNEILKIKKFLNNINLKNTIEKIGSSVKFCFICNNYGDIYIRKEKIKLWDVVAGFHIAKKSQCIIKNINGDNIYDIFLKREYLDKICKNDFKIDEFLISNYEL